MRIKVTQDDIDLGNHGSSAYCPIARGIRRNFFPKFVYVKVEPETITIANDAWSVNSFVTPGAASAFIRDFDAGVKVEPFEFYLTESFVDRSYGD